MNTRCPVAAVVVSPTSWQCQEVRGDDAEGCNRPRGLKVTTPPALSSRELFSGSDDAASSKLMTRFPNPLRESNRCCSIQVLLVHT